MLHSETRPKTKMAFVRFSNVVPINYAPLVSAPSVRDQFSPPSNPTNLDLTADRLKVGDCYRGLLFYLENGAIVMRRGPKTPGGNGHVSWLGDEPEDCYVSFQGNWYTAIVKSA